MNALELALAAGFEEMPPLWEESYNCTQEDRALDNFPFDRSFIDQALSFYRLENNEILKEQVYAFLDRILEDVQLQKAVLLIHTIMFQSSFEGYKKLWDWTRPVNDMLPTVMVLLGHQKHLKSMQKRGFDETQINDHIEDIHLRLIKAPVLFGTLGISFGSMVWTGLFQRGEVIQIGSLQYELNSFYEDLTPTDDIPKKGEMFIALHIQRNQILTPAAIDDSLNQAPNLINKYFPETLSVKPLYFACSSWLLSKQIRPLLPAKSNIKAFQDRFRIFDGNVSEEISSFLFNIVSKDAPIESFEEKTSLQKAVKKAMLDGTIFHDGIGILKNTKF